MKRTKTYVGIMTMIFLGACGGSSSSATTADAKAPTITSLVAGAMALVADTTTALTSTPTSLTLTFSEAMTPASVTTAGNITMSCARDATITATAAAVADVDAATATADDEYTVTFSSTLLEQDTCTLTIGTSVTDAAASIAAKANALAATVAYPFTTGCAVNNVNDSFTVETTMSGDSPCFTVQSTTGTQKVAGAIDTTAGTLRMTFPAGSTTDVDGEFNGFSRTFTAENLQFDLVISGITGQGAEGDGSEGEGTSDHFALYLTDTLTAEPTLSFMCGMITPNSEGGMRFSASGSQEGENTQTDIIGTGTSLATLNDGNPIYLRITKVGSSLTCAYRLTSTGDFTAVNNTASSVAFGSAYILVMNLGHTTAADDYSITIDSFTAVVTE